MLGSIEGSMGSIKHARLGLARRFFTHQGSARLDRFSIIEARCKLDRASYRAFNKVFLSCASKIFSFGVLWVASQKFFYLELRYFTIRCPIQCNPVHPTQCNPVHLIQCNLVHPIQCNPVNLTQWNPAYPIMKETRLRWFKCFVQICQNTKIEVILIKNFEPKF